MDGVLYNSGTAIEGAAETLKWVRAQRIPHLFVTNTSSRGRDVLIEKLARFGVPASKDEILTPATAAAQWLRTHASGPVALFVKPARRDEFAGLTCIGEEAASGARYVVIGDLGETWDFRTLNRAFRLLHPNPETTDPARLDQILGGAGWAEPGRGFLRARTRTRHAAQGGGVRQAGSSSFRHGVGEAGCSGR